MLVIILLIVLCIIRYVLNKKDEKDERKVLQALVKDLKSHGRKKKVSWTADLSGRLGKEGGLLGMRHLVESLRRGDKVKTIVGFVQVTTAFPVIFIMSYPPAVQAVMGFLKTLMIGARPPAGRMAAALPPSLPPSAPPRPAPPPRRLPSAPPGRAPAAAFYPPGRYAAVI